MAAGAPLATSRREGGWLQPQARHGQGAGKEGSGSGSKRVNREEEEALEAAAATGVLPPGRGRGENGSSERSAICGRERVGGEGC